MTKMNSMMMNGLLDHKFMKLNHSVVAILCKQQVEDAKENPEEEWAEWEVVEWEMISLGNEEEWEEEVEWAVWVEKNDSPCVEISANFQVVLEAVSYNIKR